MPIQSQQNTAPASEHHAMNTYEDNSGEPASSFNPDSGKTQLSG